MEELTFSCIETEEEYCNKFCEIYSEPINTPDGFRIICKNPRERAKHICCGSDNIFQKARASRIEWPKYIFLNPKERKILLDTQTKNLIFFFEKGKTGYAAICSQLGSGQLNLISGFVVAGKRKENYRDGKPPYNFYEIKKSC